MNKICKWSLLYFIILSLATYRVTRMILMEEGPFSVFEKIRVYVQDEIGEETIYFRWITCPHCIAPYVAFILLIFPGIFLLPLAAAGISTIIFEWMFKGNYSV